MNTKRGIDLIIDRVEALHEGITSSGNDAVFALSHWEALCDEAKAETIKLGHAFNAITNILALSPGETPENIALAVKICVERCQALEQKLINFQDSHK